MCIRDRIEIVLTGDAERDYDVYYSVTSSGQGKMGWAKNGEVAGTSNLGEHLVSVEVVLVPKGQPGPSSAAGRYINELTNRIRIGAEGSTMTNGDGTPYTGWASYDHERFYFKDGQSLSGWHYIDGMKFYFEPSGRLVQDVDNIIGKQSSYVTVSYTHLGAGYAGGITSAAMDGIKTAEAIARRFQPVSYTHLDVYKRQSLLWPASLSV